MRCTICGQVAISVDQAIDEGWTPYFYVGEDEKGSVCPSCTNLYLQQEDDGEMEIKSEYIGILKS